MKMTTATKFLGILCLLAGFGLSADLQAQMDHTRHHAARAELGTSAAVDAKGNLWIAGKETAADGGQYVVLQMSRDMGKTWSPPKRVQQAPEPVSADGENRPKLAFGTKDEIYIAYTKPLAKPYTGEIRFAHSLDGSRTFSAPVTVHANRDEITHRFESMIVDKAGRIYIAWIDKRDAEAAKARGEQYAGAAIYYAVSEDGGTSFKGDYKLADHTCECCRIALTVNPDGNPVALWRHVFEPNIRDHALAVLRPDGKQPALIRASFDDWHIDACPHQGPSLAYAADGTRHQTWFSGKADGGVFYAAANPAGTLGKPIRLGSAQAEHADVAIAGDKTVALAWKQFDGKSIAIVGKLSHDGGVTWQDKALATTAGNSDQPHLLHTPAGIVLVWRTQAEGVRIVPVN